MSNYVKAIILVIGFVILVLVTYKISTLYTTVVFSDGDEQELSLMDWRENGVYAKRRDGQPRFYFYVEIDTIDGEPVGSIGSFKTFMRALSWAHNILTFGYQKRNRSIHLYDKNGKTVRNWKGTCNKSKDQEDFTFYNKFGEKAAIMTCSRGNIRELRALFPNGDLRGIFTFQKGKLVGLERISSKQQGEGIK